MTDQYMDYSKFVGEVAMHCCQALDPTDLPTVLRLLADRCEERYGRASEMREQFELHFSTPLEVATEITNELTINNALVAVG